MFSLKDLTPYLWAVSVLGSAYIGYSLKFLLSDKDRNNGETI